MNIEFEKMERLAGGVLFVLIIIFVYLHFWYLPKQINKNPTSSNYQSTDFTTTATTTANINGYMVQYVVENIELAATTTIKILKNGKMVFQTDAAESFSPTCTSITSDLSTCRQFENAEDFVKRATQISKDGTVSLSFSGSFGSTDACLDDEIDYIIELSNPIKIQKSKQYCVPYDVLTPY